MTLENGYLLNRRYRILDILGQGALGVVYRAVDEKLDVGVAIKELLILSEEDTRRFESGARVLASLRHPNLPRVLDYFEVVGQAQYLIVEFVEGGHLGQWMAGTEGISEMEALQIGIASCNALIYLHSHEPAIIHCGIKPENIKFTPFGEVVLVDLGFVTNYQVNGHRISPVRAPIPGFSPPEQFGEGAIDHRSDIFSLGATLYAALAGFPPENSLDRVTGKKELSPLRSYQPHLSRQTAQVIEKALNLRYEDRWQSAQALRDVLIKTRDALPAEQRKNTRLPLIEQTLPQTQTDDSKASDDQKKSLASWLMWIKQGLRHDPVWSLFGALIILLVVFFITTLLFPQGLSGIFHDGQQNEQTLVSEAETQQASDLLMVTREAGTQSATNSFPMSEEAASVTANPVRAPTPTPTGGGAGVLAFVSDRSGVPQIFLLDVASRDVTQLTDLEDGACQPDWSPTGEKIVFTSPCSAKQVNYPGSRLVIIELSSGELTPLPASLEGDFDPAWSPDGEWIAHTTLINGREQVVKIHVRDLKSVRLSAGRYPDSSPAWSPDGEQLAFMRLRGVPQIWLMDADGENQVQFTLSGMIDNSNPAWFSDGSLVLFSQSLGVGSPSKQLYGMRIEDIGKPEEYAIIPRMQLDYIPLMDHVNVSPDGFWLAFDYWYFDILPDIYIMNFPGANLVQLTDHPGLDYNPVWSP